MFKIDLHVHTRLGGDSLIDPDELVQACIQAGLDGVCVTEHNSHALSAPLDEISARTGFPIFRGMEFNAAEGHLLIYGVNAGRSDLPPRLPMQQAVDWVQARGGLAVPAHPYQKTMTSGRLGDGVFKLKNLVALESLNSSVIEEENRRAHEAAKKMGIGCIGGSDAHGLLVLGKAYTVFKSPITNLAELVAAIKSGQYHPQLNDG